jgi:hypothetical protein
MDLVIELGKTLTEWDQRANGGDKLHRWQALLIREVAPS